MDEDRDEARASNGFLSQPESPQVGARFMHSKTKGLYDVLHVARSSDDPNDFVVVYRSVSNGQVWTRPWGEFCSSATLPDGDVVRRFEPRPQPAVESDRAKLARLWDAARSVSGEEYGGKVSQDFFEIIRDLVGLSISALDKAELLEDPS